MLPQVTKDFFCDGPRHFGISLRVVFKWPKKIFQKIMRFVNVIEVRADHGILHLVFLCLRSRCSWLLEFWHGFACNDAPDVTSAVVQDFRTESVKIPVLA